MKWLALDEAAKVLAHYETEPQTLVLYCAVRDLADELPANPRVISTEDGEPWPVNQWVGLIDSRPVIVQQTPEGDQNCPYSVTVLTPFIEPDGGRDEWSTLRELEGLPESIRPWRPLYIGSRAISRAHVVYRPNVAGWDDALYHAHSHADAERLLSDLKSRDSWNDKCFIGNREAGGPWGVIEADEERILGSYPDMSSALRVACRISTENPKESFVVKDISEKAQSKIFRVSGGTVRQAMH